MGAPSMHALMLVVLLGTLAKGASHATSTRQVVPNYQLQYPRTNGIGVGAAAAVLAGQLWVVGGSGDMTRGPLDPALTFLFQDNRRYDIATRVWSNMETLPQSPVAFHTLSVFQNALYVFGGTAGGAVFNSNLWRYNVATNTWLAIAPSTATVPPARAGHAAIVLQGRLLVFGGARSDGTLLADAWAFSFASGAWTQLNAAGPDAPGPRYLHVALEGPQANSVCVYGGSSTARSTLLFTDTTPVNSVHCYDANANVWLAARTASSAVPAVAGAAVLQTTAGGFSVIGGMSGGALSQRLLSFSFATSSWASTIASPFAYAASAQVGQYGYVFGGLIDATARAWNTRVIAVGPPGLWAEEQIICEKGYTGTTCRTPLCQRNCWNLGRCIAPDLCECQGGFTGALCSQQTCAECNVNLLELNQPIMWPRAQHRALQCMQQIQALIAQVRSLLPPFPARCGQAYTAGEYPVPLRNFSRVAYDFERLTSAPLALLSEATAQLVQLRNLALKK